MDGTIAPTAGEDAATVEHERDRYVEDWGHYNARDGVAAGTTLTNRRREGDGLWVYDVVSKHVEASERRPASASELNKHAGRLAAGLGLDRGAVLFHAGTGGRDALVRLTIIEKSPVAEPRFYAGPIVEDGVIKGVSRRIDGHGEGEMTMWDDRGTVPTMLVGQAGSGKTTAARVLTCGAVSTKRMSLLFVDPRDEASGALARHARVAVLGKENAQRAWVLLYALVRRRERHAAITGQDVLLPSTELPGWTLLLESFSHIVDDAGTRRELPWLVEASQRLGVWSVAVNHGLYEALWGDDRLRSTFARQGAIFRLSRKSDVLVAGLKYDPWDLAVDERGRAIPGFAVPVGAGAGEVPVRWDALPADGERLRQEPPLRESAALEACDRQPELHEVDVQALTEVLGPAVNGRWVIGGENATHELPERVRGL